MTAEDITRIFGHVFEGTRAHVVRIRTHHWVGQDDFQIECALDRWQGSVRAWALDDEATVIGRATFVRTVLLRRSACVSHAEETIQ